MWNFIKIYQLETLQNLQSNPYNMFAAYFQPSWPSRPKAKGTLLCYFLKLYNFGFYDIFVGSTSSEQYSTHGSQKSGANQKNREKIIFQAQIWSASNQ